jgi:hypothetical protein
VQGQGRPLWHGRHLRTQRRVPGALHAKHHSLQVGTAQSWPSGRLLAPPDPPPLCLLLLTGRLAPHAVHTCPDPALSQLTGSAASPRGPRHACCAGCPRSAVALRRGAPAPAPAARRTHARKRHPIPRPALRLIRPLPTTTRHCQPYMMMTPEPVCHPPPITFCRPPVPVCRVCCIACPP